MMIDVLSICKKVLVRLSSMDYEMESKNPSEQLIFPNKVQASGNIKRISEQELRLLFIEEFKKAHPKYPYSIETPTVYKYMFGNSYGDIKVNENGQSASLDMCVFNRGLDGYQRALNIEFKHKNTAIKNIGKDVLKLINEKENGVFIHLLDNTNANTFCNKNETGVFNKLYKAMSHFKKHWNGAENKSLQFIIISLIEGTLIHRSIKKGDFNNLESIFFVNSGYGGIMSIKGNNWK